MDGVISVGGVVNIFGGWYKEAACTNAWDFYFDTVTGAVTLYAKWVPAYTVTFDANGGTVASNSAATGIDGRLDSLPIPSRDGYMFDGWFTAAGGGTQVLETQAFTANTTIYAHWTVIPLSSYAVTFNANGGVVTPASALTDTDGKLTIALPTPTRDGYTFNGWFTAATGGTQVAAGNTFTANTTIYAQWTAITYNVTFDSQGGSAVNPATATYGGKVTAPTAPTRTGYTFGGWYKEAGCTNAWNFTADSVTGNVTLYAKWTQNQYTVTFSSQGGSAVSSAQVAHGNTVTKPGDPTRAGYTFGGWYKEAACTNAWDFDTDTVTGAVTLYAKWVFTVTFNVNGGTSTAPDPAEIKADGTIILPAEPVNDTPRPESNTGAKYVFDGWYTAQTGGTKIDATFTFSQNTTVYAHWKLNGWDWEQNGGNVRIYGTGNMKNINASGPWTAPVDVVIEDEVTSIAISAFHGCAELKTVTITSGVTTIGDSAFYSCGNLTTLRLPDTLTYIGRAALNNCGNLTEVYYGGTMEQWGKTSINRIAGFPSLTIHCTDGNATT